MRVRLDLTPLLGGFGGIAGTTADLFEALREHEAVQPSGYLLSARGAGRRDQLAQSLKTSEIIKGEIVNGEIVTSRIPASLCHATWAKRHWPRLNKLSRGVDLLHGTNFACPPAPARIISIHDYGPITHPQWCTSAALRKMPALLKAVEDGAHVHVPLTVMAQQAPELLSIAQQRCHVVPWGVRPVGDGDAEKGRRIAKADRYVLYVGATEPRKNVTILPKVVARLDVNLVVAGGVGSDEAALSKAVRDAGLDERYVRLTSVDDEIRADLFAGASVLAFPSLMEGFGLPPLEAVLAGTPVVSTAVGVVTEVFGNDLATVAPGDVDSFAQALAKSLEDVDAGALARVRERVEQMSWTNAADQFVAMYQRVLADK